MPKPRVVIVGAGAAGLAAALASNAAGAEALVLEKGERAMAGGNASYSGGLFLFAHGGLHDLADLAILPQGELAVHPYTSDEYLQALTAMSAGRADPELVTALVDDSLPTMRWLREQGVRFRLASGVFGPYRKDGQLVVPAGPALESEGAGSGLVSALLSEVERRQIKVYFETPLRDFRVVDGHLVGVYVGTEEEPWDCDAAILACGGFEASEGMRSRYLGAEWKSAKFRGTPHNTGELLDVALSHGAGRAGDWSSCHAVSVDAQADSPRRPGDKTPTRLSRGFRYGIVVNADGKRFFDEGADLWTRIYSKMGRAILAQPGAVGFHVFDNAVRKQIGTAIPGVAPIEAMTIEELAERGGIPSSALADTVREFNASCSSSPLDWDVLDGKETQGISPPKSNWAAPIEQPPYTLYRAACGVTFTHGGLKTDAEGRVLTPNERPIAGLYAAGEMTGGLFFGNYPGGSSLMRSAVFGRRAGIAAVLDLPATGS